MELFIARQPIFDLHMHVYGYELLYRKTRENRFIETDGDEATANVIINAFNILDIARFTNGRRAFVNFTGNLISQGIPSLFSKEAMIIEILENVVPTIEVVNACRMLKRLGYWISIDDFIDRPEYSELLKLADIIKVDFLTTGEAEKADIVRRYADGQKIFLAEKVESNEEYQKALRIGYTLFQGYFFSVPVIHSVGEVPPAKWGQLKLLSILHRADVEFEHISSIVSNDVSLTYKLLRLVNSAAIGRIVRIESVRQALVMLGMIELRKWLSLVIMRKLSEDKPGELIRLCLIRARLLEALGTSLRWEGSGDTLFLVGMFSCLDAMMGRPLTELLDGISVSDHAKTALLLREGMFGYLLSLVLSYEAGDWNEVTRYSEMLGVDVRAVTPLYLEAVAWCTEVLNR